MLATRLGLNRTNVIGALIALVFAVAAFAAVSIILPQESSAQRRAASPNLVRNSKPPTMSVITDYPNVQVNWEYNAVVWTPTGWELEAFQVWRTGDAADEEPLGGFNNDPDSEIFPVQSSTTRSYTDTLSHKTQADWLAGFDLRYFVRPLFKRTSDGRGEHGNQVSYNLAVKPPASRLDVLNAPAASLTVAQQHPVAQIDWVIDAESVTPEGWKLVKFEVARYSTELGTVELQFADQDADVRSFTDPLSHLTVDAWLAGFEYLYAVTPVYERVIGDMSEKGKQTVALLTVDAPTSPLDVATTYPAPTLTAAAHSDGVQLTWEFDEAASTPPGWKLAGFVLQRWIDGPDPERVWFNPEPPHPAPTDRSLKDPLSGTAWHERLPGNKFNYAIQAFYHRILDEAEQVGKRSQTVFKTPKLPNVRNFRIRNRGGGHWPGEYLGQLLWDRAHLPWGWDTDSDLGNVSEYFLYEHRDGEYKYLYESNTSEYFGHNIRTRIFCGGFQIISRYGLFYSARANAAEQRHECK